MTFMERVTPVVDDTIKALAKTKFVQDPVAGIKYSRATSIISSAYKRHGRILETALRRACERVTGTKYGRRILFGYRGPQTPWSAPKVRMLAAKAHFRMATACGSFRSTLLPSTVRIKQSGHTKSSAANGQFDAGKIRSIKRDLLCVQVLLKSYGVELAKLKPVAAESRIIFYYGVRSIPRPWSLVREELDDHFGFPVVARIEEANEYFQTKLHQLLETP
jgi:hypothetical protein